MNFEMTPEMTSALMPFFVLTAGLMVQLLAISFARTHTVALIVTLLVLGATLGTIPGAAAVGEVAIGEFARLDGYAHFFSALFVITAIVTALLSYRYLEHRTSSREEYYILLVTATFGAMTMACAAHFTGFILGLEILSISLYAMIAYPEEGQAPLEAAAKYLILSGVASTTILFGMALVYAATGSMAFEAIMKAPDGPDAIYFTLGQGMIFVGVAFKLSLVPFHMWTPDVYEGAPAPVTGFVATVSKGALFAMLLRYAVDSDVVRIQGIFFAVSLIAVVSMVVGNLLALLQHNIKRILAYSSIAHVGYLLIALLVVATAADTAMALETTMVYLVGYFAMTLAAFGVITILSAAPDSQDADDLSAYEGLFWKRPVIAAVLTTAALSLAGIPLTVGFIAKFYLFAAGVDGALWSLLWALVIGSAIGVYYYLRIVFSMTKAPNGDAERHPAASWEAMATVVVLGVVLILFGVYPTPLIDTVREMIGVVAAR